MVLSGVLAPIHASVAKNDDAVDHRVHPLAPHVFVHAKGVEWGKAQSTRAERAWGDEAYICGVVIGRRAGVLSAD